MSFSEFRIQPRIYFSTSQLPYPFLAFFGLTESLSSKGIEEKMSLMPCRTISVTRRYWSGIPCAKQLRSSM